MVDLCMDAVGIRTARRKVPGDLSHGSNQYGATVIHSVEQCLLVMKSF